MESTMAIKVKYGATLRRFSVRILENNQLDLDIIGLKEKIFNLFNFSPETDITMTYIDEDGDTVTLVNNDDLHDVMRQQLKFLRIDVQLKNMKNDESHLRSNGGSTPLRSPEGQRSSQYVCTRVAEVLKALPEPLPDTFSQLFRDFSSKAALTNPVLAELAQTVIGLGLTHLNPDSHTSAPNVATVSPMAPRGADSKSSDGDGFHKEAERSSKFSGLTSKDCKVINNGNVTKNNGVAAPIASLPSVDLNVLPTDYIASGHATEESAIAGPSRSADCKMKEEKKDKDANIGHLHERYVGCLPSPMHVNSQNSPTFYADSNYISECPFSGVPVATDSYDPRAITTNSGSIGNFHTEGVGSIFHKGIICDGCGAHPITGLRFKSRVKEDYDLCSICFAEFGNETDYIRLDHPVSYWHPRMRASNRGHPLAGPRVVGFLRRCRKQTTLDSRFLLDVNVLDGTVMAPSTPFTKIWRLLNNGTVVWPRGTRLVQVSGDRFSDSASVEIEVPAGGLPVGKELDIAVDFTAPELPGAYTSYWRMASPSGEKFGQRVWVYIQVDASLRRSHSDSIRTLDLNLPPIGGGSKGPEDVDVNPTPAIEEGVTFHPSYPRTAAEPGCNQMESEKELQFPINDALLVGQNPATSANVVFPSVLNPAIDCHENLLCSSQASHVSYPIIDFSEPIPAANPPTPSSVVSPASSEKVTADNDVEETLLKELDEMGFKQADLNKEILRKTEYNLEKSVDELCGVSEWDPILEELEEMGFVDKEMNRRLLMKNSGSIKRVVMELISGEKA